MKILVTGANGFVGRSVCERLSHEGHIVTAAVRSVGTAPREADEIIVGNSGPATDWTHAVSGQDAVVHLAARVHVMHETSVDPAEAFEHVNVGGTQSLAIAADAASVRCFVFFSSIKVHGESTKSRPFSAEDVLNPQDAYGMSKLRAENWLQGFLHGKMSLVIIRPTLIYGPNVGGNMARLLNLVDHRVPLPLGSVDNKRTLCSIDNVTDLTNEAVQYTGRDPTTVLAGDPTSHSTPELVRALGSALRKRIWLLPAPRLALKVVAFMLRQSAAADRLTGSLEIEPGASNAGFFWEPKVSFSDGIDRMGAWYREREARGEV